MNDLIRRQDAIDILDDFESDVELGVSDAYQKHMRRLEMLDAVDRPTGKWIEQDNGYFFCSKCGKYPEYQVSKTDFCPNCGVKMEV